MAFHHMFFWGGTELLLRLSAVRGDLSHTPTALACMPHGACKGCNMQQRIGLG